MTPTTAASRNGFSTLATAFDQHWPEYGIEAFGLGTFMVSACAFGVFLFHPASPVVQNLPSETERRVLMGCAMALTNIALVYSPWGRRSGAHNNPAVTLTFLTLGKVAPQDALFYMIAQFVGGIAGVAISSLALGAMLGDVHYVATVPGMFGNVVAFCAELLISFVLMTVILHVSNRPGWAHLTGVCAAILVALYISLEAPLSGMSMNPARTLGSAVAAQLWTGLWIYFLAPPLGMLLAALLYRRQFGIHGIFCAKLCHDNRQKCIFCAYRAQRDEGLSQGR